MKLIQMMAHDVRKPFSLFRMLLQTLYEMNFDKNCQNYIESAQGEIEKALRDVNSFVDDVLELNRNIEISYKSVNLDNIIYESLLGSARNLEKDYRLKIVYDLRHTHQVIANDSQIKRVMTNIMSNAFQAMKEGGKIWIQTIEFAKDKKIEVCIGNSSSYIPPEKRQIIFKDFYSEGKKSGTGLGLAIVKKIIKEHHGKIWIESDMKKGTEFRFTLDLDPSTPSMGMTSLPMSREALPMGSSIRSTALSKNIISRSYQNTNVSILHYDPEPFYLSSVEELLKTKTRKEDKIHYHGLSDLQIIGSMFNVIKPDIVIINHDNENEREIEATIEGLSSRLEDQVLVLHGYSLLNQSLLSDKVLFVEKPLNTRKIAELIRKIADQNARPDEINQISQKSERQNLLIVVDDSPFILDRWKKLNTNHDVELFLSPESFIAALDEGTLDLAEASVIILDYYFGESSNMNGVELSQYIRKRFSNLDSKLILSSDRKFENSIESIDHIMEKEPMELNQLEVLIESTQSD